MVVAIIAAHGLWERALDRRVRDQVILFNVATTATVVIGIVTLYVALFALVLAGATLAISQAVFEEAVGGEIGWDYATLAWFIASFATIGGALGAALESDHAVRQAAYAAAVGED